MASSRLHNNRHHGTFSAPAGSALRASAYTVKGQTRILRPTLLRTDQPRLDTPTPTSRAPKGLLLSHAAGVVVAETAAPSSVGVSAGASSDESAPFVWTRYWWPLLPLRYLRADRPTPVTLLGIPMVVWRDGAGAWRVFRDRCPHRMAPLSEGRVESDGSLSCSYHGWRFDGSGTCTRIPQAVSPEAEATACRSQRSCVTSFPAQELAGMLWVWPDDSPDAAAASASAPVEISANLRQRAQAEQASKEAGKESPFLPITWMMRELPYSYEVLVENLADPSHLPFSHHGVVPMLKRSVGKSMPMQPSKGTQQAPGQLESAQQEGSSIEAAAPTLPDHWARPTGPDYEFDFVGNVSPDATIALHMPHHVSYLYRVGQFVDRTELFAVPVAPGRSRFFAPSRPVTSKLPPLNRIPPKSILPVLLSRLDPVVSGHVILNTILDGDSVFLHVQDRVLQGTARPEASAEAVKPAQAAAVQPHGDGNGNGNGSASNGGSGGSVWPRVYYLPTQADTAVLAGRKWCDERAGGGPFADRQRKLLAAPAWDPSGSVAGTAPTPEERRSVLLNRYDQHTRHCPDCRTRLEQLQRLAAAAQAAQTACLLGLAVAGGALGALAAVQGAAAAASAGWPAVLLALCSALWAAAGAVARVARDTAARLVFVDYVHAEKH